MEAFCSIGSHGIKQGQFNNPTDVAVDSIGNIFVTDSGNERIQKFDKNGNFVMTFGTFGHNDRQFDNLLGIEIDENDNIFVTN